MERKTDGFSVAAVFSDHCVLQRRKNVCVFGSAPDGEAVHVTLSSADGTVLRSARAESVHGRWEAYLAPLEAQENLLLSAECGTKRRTFSDVAVGEVWLAGGQSNMEFELGNCTEGPAALSSAEECGVRFYYTQKIAWMDDAFFEAERRTSWETWQSGTKSAWSAVGFFFARKLSAELGVTVGIIGCNWGGTSASAWMSRSRMEKDSDLYAYLAGYDKATSGKSEEEQCREYDEYLAYHEEWQKKCDALYKENPGIEWDKVQEILGTCRWPGPDNCKNPFRPAGLYGCMLRRVMPYTLKGFIYYQGESDDHRPAAYYKLFRELIDQWRTDWHDDALPFLFVQLPEHRYRQDKDFLNWPLIREAQAKAARTIRGTGMVCAMGLGEYDDIHPKHKEELALRLARLALCRAYGLVSPALAESPFPTGTRREGQSLVVSFGNADGGLCIREDRLRLERYRALEERQGNALPEGFSGFEVAGKDKVYHPAAASAGEDGTLVLSSDAVPDIAYARYAWYNYGPVVLFSRNGLPVPPFRTSPEDGSLEASDPPAKN